MPLKIGIVGMNNIAQPHAAAYAADELGDLVAICDRVRERADAGAEKFGAKAYHSLADMLDGEPDLDIVDVCTGGYENGSWHYEPAMQAMEAGKHVLVEKPLSSDVGEAREMVAKAAERGVYLGCNLNHYFSPPAERARKHLDDGDVGELVYCLCKMGFNGSEPESYNAPGGMVKGFPYFHLKAFLSHPLSVMRYLCGDVTHVQAFLERPGFRRRAGDVMLTTASVHLRFANGAVGYLLSQRGDCTYGLGGWWSVEVAGTKGTFCIENCIEKLTWWKAPQPNAGAAGEVYESGTADFGLTFNHRIHAWLEDISNGVPLEQVRGSGRDALAALEITWAAMESYEQGGILVRPQALPALRG